MIVGALEIEFLALPAASPAYLAARGLDVSALAQRGMIVRAAKVAPLAGGCFEFSDEGRAALVIPVTAWHGEVTDLIAMDRAEPTRWRPLLGKAAASSWALGIGEDHPGYPIRVGDSPPLRVHASPWHWLLASAEGSVILDAERARFNRDAFADRLVVADDEAQALAVRAALAPRAAPLRVAYLERVAA